MTYTLVVGNAHDDPRAISTMAAVGHYCMFNEGGTKANAAIRRMAASNGWDAYVPRWPGSQNPHLWRSGTFQSHGSATFTLLKGGRLGLAGAKVSRLMLRRWAKHRRGPTRCATASRDTEIATKQQVIHVDVHKIARSRTKERWRRVLFNGETNRLLLVLQRLERDHPGVPIILGGDMNDSARLAIPARYVRQNTLADMGRARYTHLYVNQNGGHCAVSKIREQHNASDHDAVLCEITLGRAA